MEEKKEVIINREWCKGCGICVAFCPKKALDLDDEEKALQILQEGLNRRERELAWLGQMSEFDSLRGRPEFQAIIEEIGVPNARTAVGG